MTASAPPRHAARAALRHLLTAAQRGDDQSLNVAGQKFALGISVTASRKVVVVALPLLRA